MKENQVESEQKAAMQHPQSMDALRSELRDALTRELDPGETVLWVGQPNERLKGRDAFRAGLAATLLSFFFAAIVVASLITDWRDWIRSANRYQDELFSWHAATELLPFIGAIGFAILLSGFGIFVPVCLRKLVRRKARKTVYAITESRALVLFRDEDEIHERDYRADELIHLYRRERPDGVGSLKFENARGGSVSSHGFEYIEDVIEVERLLRKTFGGHSIAGNTENG